MGGWITGLGPGGGVSMTTGALASIANAFGALGAGTSVMNDSVADFFGSADAEGAAGKNDGLNS